MQRIFFLASRGSRHCSVASALNINNQCQQPRLLLPSPPTTCSFSVLTLPRRTTTSNSISSSTSSFSARILKSTLVDGNRCSKRHASITTTDTSADDFEHELSSFMECLQVLLESARFERANLDVNLADGVLSVASPTAGTWVLNKHTPTRQIWLSSPISGPRKFNFHAEEAEKFPDSQVGEGWKGERDLSDSLKHRIISEWKQAFAVDIDPIADFRSEHH